MWSGHENVKDRRTERLTDRLTDEGHTYDSPPTSGRGIQKEVGRAVSQLLIAIVVTVLFFAF